MKRKILFSQPWKTDAVPHFSDYVWQLEENGCEVAVFPEARGMKTADMLEWLPGVYGHICGSDEWTAQNMDAVKDIKIISRIGVGYESVDVAGATERGIAVAITPGAGAETVAEYAISMMAAMTRKIPQNDAVVRSGQWYSVIGHSFYRKTIGIVGLGLIGRQLAKWVQAFGMKVLAYDLKPDEAYAAQHGIEYTTLPDLLKRCDYLSLHLPLTEQTRGLIGARELAAMKPTAQIINAARGGIIDEQALYEALRDGIIDAAALDVFEREPIEKDNPLLTLDNVIFSPHLAGSTYEGLDSITGMAVQNVIDYINGKRPAGILNPEIL